MILADTLLREKAIEHSLLIEAAHFHEPVDNLGPFADGKPGGRNAQRNGAKIDIGGQSPVQLDLSAASDATLLDRREVEIGKADRLLELEDNSIGEEDRGTYGFRAPLPA